MTLLRRRAVKSAADGADHGTMRSAPVRRPARLRRSLLVVASVVAAVLITAEVPPAAAASDTTQVPLQRNVSELRVPIGGVTPLANGGHVGVALQLEDGTQWGYDPCLNGADTFHAACVNAGPSYYKVRNWTSTGTTFTPNITVPNSESTPSGTKNHQWANRAKGVRLEFYPYGPGGTYDPATSTVGGVHLNAFGVTTGFDGRGYTPDVGTVPFPVQGAPGTARIGGNVRSTLPVTAGRLQVDVFQEHSIYDPYDYRKTSTGVDVGAFASLPNSGSTWTSGPIFDGLYHLFIEDKVRNTKIQVLVPILGTTSFDLDLEATCFGFDECAYDKPTPFAPVISTGGYHPLTPARIFDSRFGIGRPFGVAGPVSAGDGSSPGEPNPQTRAFNQAMHEVKVTGVGGVPSTGVSAVVLNVTATGPTAASHLSVYPKPPRSTLYDDQGSFGAGTIPSASNLNVVAGQTVPNLVVARVGAGGKVRILNNSGSSHVIFDVVGWFDTGTASGDGFTGITPERMLDTRAGSQIGPYATPFGAGQTRPVTVVGGAVPSDATAVVANITVTGPTAASHLTAWPHGVAMPKASNLNFSSGQTVPNLAIIGVGAGGQIDVFNNAGTAHVIVDVVGYFRSGAGDLFTPAVTPKRLLDTRSTTKVGAGEVRTLDVDTGVPVPPGAAAAVLNTTAVFPSANTHLTVFPDGVSAPNASNLNPAAGTVVPNLVITKLGSGGRVAIRNNSGTVDVLSDVAGWFG